MARRGGGWTAPCAARERGAAVVDFTLVMLVLIPLFLGIMQVALFLHVRNTMVACASEGARYGANYNRRPGAGAVLAADCISGSLSSRFARHVTANTASAAGQQLVVVTARASMPALGLWGPGAIAFSTTGHAVREPQP